MAGRKAPENETKEARFVRIANIRAGNAIAAIEGIGKLVGSQYVSTKEQHAKLFGALRAKIDQAEKQLAANKAPTKVNGGVL